MKILDRYILSSYLKTFISVFVILMLIFVLQAIWLYIKELAGKDLDPATIAKFLFYITPTLIPLILPLTILLSSIMVFGNFAENYEFAAMKSTGISLRRAMSGLSIFIIALGVTTFFFSNNVIPWAEYNSYNLRKNIAKVKPAMAIAEGQFNQIGESFNIKVSKKTGDRGQFLETIVIHKGQKSKPGNYTTIIAETGELVSEKKSDVLKLILHDGYYYDDTPPKDYKERLRKPFAKSIFKKYTMNIDLSQLNASIDLDAKSTDNKYSMLSISQLNYTTDSLYLERQKVYSALGNKLYKRTNIKTLNLTVNTKKDTIYNGDILDLFKNTKRKVQLLDYAINAVSSTTQIITTEESMLKFRGIWLNKHIIALHEKFALAFACIILFFVGAPLGALIRKGGLGLPMVIAIVLFLTYHFIGIFAKNSAKDGSFNPVMAAWFSTLIMLPLSIYLTSKATKDRGLFETDGLLEPLKKLFGIKRKNVSESDAILDSSSNEYITLESYDNNKLIDVIQNYRTYDYTISYKNSAVAILNERGISKQELKYGGHFTNQKYEEAIRLKELYEENSKLSIILYFITLITIVSGLILANNKFESIGNIISIIGYIIGVVFLFALIKSSNNISNLNNHLGKNITSYNLLYILIGLPLYFVNFYFQKRKIEAHLKVKPSTKVVIEDDLISKKIKGQDNDKKALTTNSIIAFILAIILLILHFVFANNKLPQFASASIQLSLISFTVFIFYFIKRKIAR